METPTPLQQQIEYLVTNGRGYTPQITPTVFSRLSEKMYLIDFYAALEQQRLQDALGSMERQQSSPTLDALFTNDLDRILRSTARPGSDIELIKNYEDPRKFSKITPLKERFSNNETPDRTIPFSKKGANAGHEVPLDPDTIRAYRAKLLAMGLNPFAVDGPDPGKNWGLNPSATDQPPRHVYDVFSSDARLSSPDLGKNWEFPYLKPRPEQDPCDMPWKKEPKNFEPPETASQQRDTSDLLHFLPPPKPSSNPAPEPLDSQDPLDKFLRKLDPENRKKDSEKKWIE
ncbi:MAG: hypothetical protein Q8L34_02445 [Candidatus Woesearchaeota archaeon]|nr:hypothetical protein [Candidatus Woesearchaeota archaeon]